MLATIEHKSKKYKIDLSKPINIAIELRATPENVNAWYQAPPQISPVEDGDFIGSVAEGAPVNFNNIFFNPHAHGTHTETIGHITKKSYPIHQYMSQFFFFAEVITVVPEAVDDDFIISKKQLQFAIGNKKRQAIIIRTLPNLNEKKNRQYSNTNPPYLTAEGANYLREKGVEHLLIDLPSVDKEHDDGELLAHKAFWNFFGNQRTNATITELIFVPNNVQDGTYFLNIMVAPFANDASPSKPVLYEIM